MRQEQRGMASKASEFEMENNEHRLVITKPTLKSVFRVVLLLDHEPVFFYNYFFLPFQPSN